MQVFEQKKSNKMYNVRQAKVKKERGAGERPSVGSRKDAREMHNAVSGRAAMLLADYSAGSVVAYAIFDDDELAVLDGLEGLDLVSGVVDSGSWISFTEPNFNLSETNVCVTRYLNRVCSIQFLRGNIK